MPFLKFKSDHGFKISHQEKRRMSSDVCLVLTLLSFQNPSILLLLEWRQLGLGKQEWGWKCQPGVLFHFYIYLIEVNNISLLPITCNLSKCWSECWLSSRVHKWVLKRAFRRFLYSALVPALNHDLLHLLSYTFITKYYNFASIWPIISWDCALMDLGERGILPFFHSFHFSTSTIL